MSKIFALTRIRNESEIIVDTLDHFKTFASHIVIYDDASTDNTVELCKEWDILNPEVDIDIIENYEWSTDRENAETTNRQELLVLAKSLSQSGDDWFVYMDADERLDMDYQVFEAEHIDAITMRLFDFYITEEDKDLDYTHRKFIGPEYRDILFAYRHKVAAGFVYPDQRECMLNPAANHVRYGFVKHYGKSFSIQQWEDTCEYYATHFPKYSAKWNARRGKAIHTESDFGADLITWDQKESNGYKLEH